ncbi:MAG: HlyD family efflux transporter periplasmic adaptor subunit [Desulfatiglandaceae bacterium]
MAIAVTSPKGPGRQQPGAAPPPVLREDLRLFPAEAEMDGSAAWVLHDPLSDRFFRLSWVEVELLSLMDRGTTTAIAREAAARTGQVVSNQDVEDFLRFLDHHNLVQAVGDAARKKLGERAALLEKGRFKRFTRQYLFIRLPLFRPDRFLERTLSLVSWAFHPFTRRLVILSGLLGLFLAIRQADRFIATALDFLSLEGLLWYAIAIIIVKIMHELAHAYSAKRAGCHVSSIGLAILVFWPVMFTDVTHAWKLQARGERLKIGAAGMIFELALACLALLAWGLLPDGTMRDAVFVLATASWITTLVVNLNPLLRFDGYYLLSDLWRIPNLQERSLALAKWKTGEFLFGLGDPPPEALSDYARRRMLVYAYACVLYRLMLVALIAGVIYALFFKVMSLMLVALLLAQSWGEPLLKGLAFTYKRRSDIQLNKNLVRTLFLLLLGGVVLFYPWHRTITAPAVLQPISHATVYTPVDCRVAEVFVEPGINVKAGQKLARLETPDMAYEVADLQRRIDSLRWQVSVRAFDATLLDRALVLDSELITTLERLRARQAEIARNRIRSPIDGRITWMKPGMMKGAWIGADESLFMMFDDRKWRVMAYVSETDLSRLEPGMQALFFPNRGGRPPVKTSIDQIETAALRELDSMLPAAPVGGAIPVRRTDDDRLVPIQSLYRVSFTVESIASPLPDRLLAGKVSIKGRPRGLAQRLSRHILGVLRREGGF